MSDPMKPELPIAMTPREMSEAISVLFRMLCITTEAQAKRAGAPDPNPGGEIAARAAQMLPATHPLRPMLLALTRPT